MAAKTTKLSTPSTASRRKAGSVVAAPSSRRLHLVMHDFQPGWDTYIERRGYGLEANIGFDQVRVEDYEAVLLLGGRAPEYLRNHDPLLEILRGFDRATKWIFAICHAVQDLPPAGLPTVNPVPCFTPAPTQSRPAA